MGAGDEGEPEPLGPVEVAEAVENDLGASDPQIRSVGRDMESAEIESPRQWKSIELSCRAMTGRNAAMREQKCSKAIVHRLPRIVGPAWHRLGFGRPQVCPGTSEDRTYLGTVSSLPLSDSGLSSVSGENDAWGQASFESFAHSGQTQLSALAMEPVENCLWTDSAKGGDCAHEWAAINDIERRTRPRCQPGHRRNRANVPGRSPHLDGWCGSRGLPLSDCLVVSLRRKRPFGRFTSAKRPDNLTAVHRRQRASRLKRDRA